MSDTTKTNEAILPVSSLQNNVSVNKLKRQTNINYQKNRMIKEGNHINSIVMNKQQNFLKAFYHAWKGIQHFFLHDRNGRIHMGAAAAVIMAGFILHVTAAEWIMLLLCIAAVISLEMINAAIEMLCDMVHKDFHPTIKIIKDVSAAAVLWASIISIVIGIIIFLPKIIALL